MDLNPTPTPILHHKELEFEDGAKTEIDDIYQYIVCLGDNCHHPQARVQENTNLKTIY